MNVNGISNQYMNYPTNFGGANQSYFNGGGNFNSSYCMPLPSHVNNQSNLLNGLIQLVGQLVNSLTQMVGQLVSLVTGSSGMQGNNYASAQLYGNDPMLSGLYNQQLPSAQSSGSTSGGWLDSIFNFGKDLFGGLFGGSKESSGGGFFSGLINKGASLIGGLF